MTKPYTIVKRIQNPHKLPRPSKIPTRFLTETLDRQPSLLSYSQPSQPVLKYQTAYLNGLTCLDLGDCCCPLPISHITVFTREFQTLLSKLHFYNYA